MEGTKINLKDLFEYLIQRMDMEGTRINLKERRLEKLKRRNWSEEERHYTKSSYYHSYSFRFDKPYKKFAKEKTDPVLKITNLELPSNIRKFNTGSSLERWSKKPIRLKSSRKQRDTTDHEDTDDEDNVQQDVDIEEMFFENSVFNNEQNNNEPEIDKDVQKLILDSAKFDEEDDEELRSSKKSKRKPIMVKEKRKKRKGKKKLTFTLSRPASPATVQVIRVDVTSNYSLDDDIDTDADDYCERFQDILNDKEEQKEVDNDFTVMCKKLTLSARD